MWMMTLMSGKWYARDYGTVVSICDDLETWCDEVGVAMDDVVIIKDEDE